MIERIIVSVLSGALGAALFVAGLQYFDPDMPKIATVNLTKITMDRAKWVRDQNISKAQATQQAKEWGARLDRELKTMAHDYHVALVVKEAAIAGVPDLTRELTRRLTTNKGENDG